MPQEVISSSQFSLTCAGKFWEEIRVARIAQEEDLIKSLCLVTRICSGRVTHIREKTSEMTSSLKGNIADGPITTHNMIPTVSWNECILQSNT